VSRITARSGPRLLALLAVISLALSAAALVAPAVVLADGADSPPECTALVGSEDGGAGDEVTVTAEEGQVIDAICIKSGEGAIEGEKHSGLITEDGTIDGCYVVDGLGTDEVTVTRVDDEDCKEISHVDFRVATAPTPTPTPTPTPFEPTPTPTATEGGGQLGGNPTATPRGAVLGGNPVPNTAMEQGASSPALPALSLSLLLIGSLALMAYLRLARDRR
jgi:hypothetical protein